METRIERVDDIPLLVAEFEKSGLSDLLNEHFPDHGNWAGTDGGTTIVTFLTYILSCGDHRLSQVETWASERIETLRYCFNKPEMERKDFTDDKLAALLERFSDIDKWSSFEKAHNQRLIHMYDLNCKEEAIRLDAMLTQSHRKESEEFKLGHSKQHRADLPQLKTMVATLDPMAMPLCSLTVSGNTADDVLYLPVIKELLLSLDLSEQLFVGDSKMGSMEIRSYIHRNNQYYLTPLSKKQCSRVQLAAYLNNKPNELVEIYSENDKGPSKLKAQGFEQIANIEDQENGVCWKERRIIVYSPAFGERQKAAFIERLGKAINELSLVLQSKQGRKKLNDPVQIQFKVQKIITKYRVKEFINVTIEEKQRTKTIRAYGNRPERKEQVKDFELAVKINQDAKEEHLQTLGWRAYACNAPQERLDTQKAILCYRNEYRIEHKFDELINRITALMPVFLQKPNRIKALIRLLLLALKFVSLTQYKVRQELKNTKQNIKELYPGNPSRATDKPTTNMILKAFKNISLSIVSVENKIYVKISDLKPVQAQILKLLNLDPEIYLGINKLSFSYFDFSET